MDIANSQVARKKVIKKVIFGAGTIGLASLLLLLIPDREPSSFPGAGKQPFLWDRDVFWNQLEQQFVAARSAGCDAIAEELGTALESARQILKEISKTNLPPEDPHFQLLETNLFRLAPLIGACPAHFALYADLVFDLRSEIKAQSQHWELEALSTRATLYRILYGSRMALEEALLQAPTNVALNLVAHESASPAPYLEFLGVKLHSGDILLSRGGAPTSALIARGNDYPGSFSHVALLHVDEKSGAGSMIESHIECGVTVSSFAHYIKDKKLRVLVLRLRPDLPALVRDPLLPHKVASQAMIETRAGHIPYDFTMNYEDPGARFCSEVVSVAYAREGIRLWMGISYISAPTVCSWLGSVGAKHFETQEPSDLEYDPQLQIVAEWRERASLVQARIDDAATDAMLETAPQGEPLEYQRYLLPATRLAKAYSALLNSLGKVGPIPEGMNATSALRVKKYQEDHAVISARVRELAAEFEKEKQYAAPYWELVRMAKQARQQ